MNSCTICFKSYKRPEHLRRHLLSHSTWRPYVCASCGSSFQRSDVLRRHQQTCDGPDHTSAGDLEPPLKKQVLFSPALPPQTGEGALDAHLNSTASTILDELPLPDPQNAFHLEQIANWASSAEINHDDDIPADLWRVS